MDDSNNWFVVITTDADSIHVPTWTGFGTKLEAEEYAKSFKPKFFMAIHGVRQLSDYVFGTPIHGTGR